MAGVRRAHTTAAARRQRAGPSSSSADDTTHSTSLSGPIPAREKTKAAVPVADPGATRRGAIERNFDVRVVLAHRGRVARLPVLPRFTNSRSVNFAEGADQLDLATQRMPSAQWTIGAGARLQSAPSQPLDLAPASGILGAAAGAAVRVVRPYGQEEEPPGE